MALIKTSITSESLTKKATSVNKEICTNKFRFIKEV